MDPKTERLMQLSGLGSLDEYAPEEQEFAIEHLRNKAVSWGAHVIELTLPTKYGALTTVIIHASDGRYGSSVNYDGRFLAWVDAFLEAFDNE